jgi:hypothetical protein
VYNPFDLLLLFKEREFRSYWFETGTPTFLVDLLTNRHTFTPDLAKRISNEALLSSFDVDEIATEALMFQAGYLTIRDIQRIGVQQRYVLGYPNREVESSLNEVLLRRYTAAEGESVQISSRLYECLLINDFESIKEIFTAFYASIPNDWYRNNSIAQYEGYYASVFYSYFASLGLDIRLEDVTNRGRIDMTVLFNNQIYIIEFKVVETAPEGKAMAQLKARNYAEKYQAHQQLIHLIGVEFSKEAKSVVGFEVEHIG